MNNIKQKKKLDSSCPESNPCDDSTKEEVLDFQESSDAIELQHRGSEVFSASHINSVAIYLKEIGYSPLLTAQEEVDLGRRIKRNDEAARSKMIESNFVQSVLCITIAYKQEFLKG